jgi:hypothetical protein
MTISGLIVVLMGRTMSLNKIAAEPAE